MLGTLVLGWDTPHQVDVTERAVLTAIAGYTARAIERALYLDQRVTVAIQLQQAMLTDLPAVSGLQLGALYRPAADGELVGGDWYDAYPLGAAARGPHHRRGWTGIGASAGANGRRRHRARHAGGHDHGTDPQHASPG